MKNKLCRSWPCVLVWLVHFGHWHCVLLSTAAVFRRSTSRERLCTVLLLYRTLLRHREGLFIQRHTRADRVLFARTQQHDSDREQARQVPRHSPDRDRGLQREPRHGRSTVLFIRLYQSASLASRQSISVGVLGGAHAKVKEVDGGHLVRARARVRVRARVTRTRTLT